MPNLRIFIFLFLSTLLLSCSASKKIATLKPEPDDAAPLVYENNYSYINMPVNIGLKDVESLINKNFSGLIFEDTDFEGDDVKMKVWKEAPIQVLEDKNQLKTVLPLKALVEYRLGNNKLSSIQTFNLNGTVTFISDVALTNWKLKTKTTLKSLYWKESPTMSLLGSKVPVTRVITPAIVLFKSAIEESVDAAIAKSMDFKPQVLDALQQICEPFLTNEAYESWLRVAPVELYTTNATLKDAKISFEMGLKCTLETLLGNKPESKFNRDKIVLKPVTKIPDNAVANIVAVSTYKEASRLMTKNFKGYVFGEGKRKVTVQNVEIWQKSNKMIIAMNLVGSVNGVIYLSGYPQYNEITKEVYFDKLEYVLDTKNVLAKSANWLAGNYMLTQLQERCRYNIEPNLEEGKKAVLGYLNNYSPMPGVFINGNVNNLSFQRIQLTNQAIVAFIKANGKVEVKVDGI